MTVLSTKERRDLIALRGRALSIIVVVAVGIASFIAMRGNWDALETARDRFYEQSRFGDVFASAQRAPRSVVKHLEAIDGVASVDARVSQGVTLPIGDGEPIAGVAIGVRGDQPGTLNVMRVVRGHAPEIGRSDQVVLLEAFAHARDIHLGDEIAVVVLGRMKRLRVVGIGVSAEYLFTMPPGEMMPDVARFAVLWLDETALSVAADMEGSVNRFSARVQPGTSAERVAKEFDRVLHDYGGLGTVTRSRQQSNFILESELVGLRNMSFAMPMIFLAVAALLLNLIMKRIVREHRGQIATLAAVGYSSSEIAWSYGRIALLVGAAGAIGGVALGWALGIGLTDIYRDFFALPGLVFKLRPGAAIGALVASCLAALIGAVGALRSILALAPAEAMRPPAPQKYGHGAFASFSLLSPMLRMTLRELARKPLRTLGTVTAVASAVALLVMARWFDDAMTLMIDTQFRSALRDDVTVNLHEAVPVNQLRMFEHLPGVIRAEGLRVAPIRIRRGNVSRDIAIFGHDADGRLRRVLGKYGDVADVPPDGVLLTSELARILNLSVGERVEVDFREGDFRTRHLTITGFVDETFGLSAHADFKTLTGWLEQEPRVSTVLLRLEERTPSPELLTRLREIPAVAGVSSGRHAVEQMEAQSGEMMVVFGVILSLFAASITVGVVYNMAKAALASRARDLASLRVLGFHRTEVAQTLGGEILAIVTMALPVGMLMGRYVMLPAMMLSADPEMYRLPIILSGRTLLFATAVTVAATVMGFLLVNRELKRLDPISALKTRE